MTDSQNKDVECLPLAGFEYAVIDAEGDKAWGTHKVNPEKWCDKPLIEVNDLVRRKDVKALIQDKIEELRKDISYFTYRDEDVETREAVKELRELSEEIEQ